MRQRNGTIVLAVLALVIGGCGKPESPAPEANGATASQGAKKASPEKGGPEAVVAAFLEAVRAGDDAKTFELLTAAAQETIGEVGMAVSPPGSDTAEFEVGGVEYVNDGARVTCELSDLDSKAERQSQEVTWMVRQEAEGWRIAGVAAEVTEGEPLRALNFEDAEMMRRLNGLEQEAAPQGAPEAASSPAAEKPSAREAAQPESPIRR